MSDIPLKATTIDQNLQEEIRCLEAEKQRLTEYHTVRRNKIIVLRQMLTIHFTTDMVVEEKTVRRATNPEEVVELTVHWVSYHCDSRLTNCDLNARFCWATLIGGIKFPWAVGGNSYSDRDFICVSIKEWLRVRKVWLSSIGMTTMIVRLSSNDSGDGHSVVSHKYQNMVWTFQSFYDTCGLQLQKYDIFDEESSLITSLIRGEKVDATAFGLTISPVREDLRKAKYEKCYYLTK